MTRDIIEELKRMHEFSPNCGICYNGKTAQEWYEEYLKGVLDLIALQRTPPDPVWRVRCISCDGGRPGREWSSEFFIDHAAAEKRLRDLVAESNQRNPKYLYTQKLEILDGLAGYCNWQFGTMLAMDEIQIK